MKDFKTFINGVSNDLKIAIDDLTQAILTIHEDVEKLKSEQASNKTIEENK